MFNKSYRDRDQRDYNKYRKTSSREDRYELRYTETFVDRLVPLFKRKIILVNLSNGESLELVSGS
jgi:hypothetical protein